MDEKNLEDYSGIMICKNGFLMEKEWVPPTWDNESDKQLTEGYYSTKDITEDLPMNLYSPCRLEKGLTLRDLFKLCQKHRDFLSKIQFKNYFLQFLDYGLNAPPTKSSEKGVSCEGYGGRWEMYELRVKVNLETSQIYPNDSTITLTNISTKESKIVELHKKGEERENSISHYYDFSGVSFPITKEDFEKLEEPYGYLIGERVRFSGLGSNLRETIDLPLVLNKNAFVTETTLDSYENYEVLWSSAFKLGDIINEVFYELSYHGLPEDAQEFKKQLSELAQKARKQI